MIHRIMLSMSLNFVIFTGCMGINEMKFSGKSYIQVKAYSKGIEIIIPYIWNRKSRGERHNIL